MMRRRVFLILLALILVTLGAGASYMALTVPRDLAAAEALRGAREHIKNKNQQAARENLEAILRDYPRTDAAFAASYALFRMQQEERARLSAELEAVKKQREQDQMRIAVLEGRISGLEAELAEAKKPAPAAPPEPAKIEVKKSAEKTPAAKPPAKAPPKRTKGRRNR